MNDSFASWMVGGGRRADADARHSEHLVAIRESRAAAKADRPSIVDRVRGRVGLAASPAVDGCVA